MNFEFLNWRERKAMTFDKDKIFVERQGKKINVNDWIQEGREDTEIYPTLEKYGCAPSIAAAKSVMGQSEAQEMYGEIKKINGLRGAIEQAEAAKKMWENLPLDIRAEFGHNAKEFAAKGENWLKTKLEKFKEMEKIQNEKILQNTIDSRTNNLAGTENSGTAGTN